MATVILRPVAAGNYTQWNGVFPALSNHFAVVDEVSQNGDTDYIFGSTVATLRDSFTLESWSPGSVTITQVKVYFWSKRMDTNPQVTPFLRLGGIDSDGTIVSPDTLAYTEYSEAISRPGGGSWQVSDFSTLQVGVIYSNAAKTAGLRVTQIYIEVTYTAANFPSPTSLECERQTTPTNASEYPLFSAIFEGDAGGNADQYYVQVSEVSDFSTTMWNSGFLNLSTPVVKDTRCAEITYAGSDLSSDPPNGVYYWRIKFKRTSDGTVSEWSTASQFSGIVHPWADPACTFRRSLPFNRDHPALTTSDTARFTLKTGNRHVVSNIGCFNEALQASGSFQTEYFGGKDHVVFLSKYGDDSKLGIYIRSYDYYLKEWGALTKIDDAKTDFDTHHYPSMCIDNSGFIYVTYGCHLNASGIYFARSSLPNDSTSWIYKKTIGTGDYTYPILFCVPSDNRVYISVRAGDRESYVLIYTANQGLTFNGPYKYVENADISGERLYQYGIKFDRKTERLHVAWTDVTGVSMNASYMYSDYTGINEGFEEWYDVTHTKIGETTTDPVKRTDLTSCIDTDAENEYFVSHLALTKTGQPLVFVQHYYRGDGSDNLTPEERGIICFRYSAGWIGSYITEDHDILMRVGRSGTPAIADKNGTIHMFTAVGGVTHKHGLPTADGYHINYSCSTGIVGYALVDDGIIKFDSSDYIYGTGAGEASFTSSATLPAKAQPLAVGVECMAKLIGATAGSLTFFVRISGTDYEDSTPQTLDDATRYIRFRNEWSINPATSLPWTVAEIEAVEFGVKQTVAGASWRIGRVTKRAKVHTSIDDEYHAAEIVEFTSTDEGINWLWKQITENSGIGVPMISIKHHPTNNSIGIVYTAGNDVFYLTNEPWGKMLPSGRDIKIVSQGGGTATELDRIIDTPNMLESTIYFKLPVVVGAGRTAGNRDLLAYYGNANARNDDRPGDPNSVYGISFDGFEELEGGSDLNGQAGWSGTPGYSIIYESPPSHNNKVAAGSKCANLYGSIYDKTIGSGLTDVCYEGYFFQNSYSAGPIMVCLLDSVGTVFGAGVKEGSGYAGYYSEGAWHDVTAKPSSSFQMIHVKLQVTASGCSAWVDGYQVADEVLGITSVDKVRMNGVTGSYFDNILGYYRHFKRLNATISSGFSKAAATWDSNHTSSLSGQDAYHNITDYTNIFKIELKVRAKLNVDQASKYVLIHGWVSNNSTYDADDIEDNATDQIDLIYDTWVSKILTFSDMTVGNKSVKVDFYDTNATSEDVVVEIEEIKIYYEIHDPLIVVGPEEVRGWYSTASIRGLGHQQWTSTATIGGWLLIQSLDMPVSSNKQTRRLLESPVESARAAAVPEDIPVSSGNRVEQYLDTAIESARAAAVPEDTPIESIRATIDYVDLPTSSGKRLILTLDNPISSGILTKNQIDLLVESARRLAATIDNPVGSIRNSIVLLDTPVSSSAKIADLITLPVESAISGLFLIDLNIGSTQRSLVSNDLPIEAARIGGMVVDLPVASACAAAIGIVLPVSSVVRSILPFDCPISSAAVGRMLIDFPSSSALKVIDVLTFPLSSGVRTLAFVDAPVESIANLIVSLNLPVSSAIARVLTIEYPLSSALRCLSYADLIIGSIRQTIHAVDLPLSSGLISATLLDLPVSDTHGVLTEVTLPVSSGMVVASPVDLPISAASRALMTALFDLPIGSIRRTLAILDAPIGSERRSIIGLTLPISSGMRTVSDIDLPASSIRRLILDATLPLSSGKIVTYASDFPLSSGLRLLNPCDIPIGSISRTFALLDLPLSSGSVAASLVDLPVADTQRMLQALILPVSSGLRVLVPVELPVEAGQRIAGNIDLPTDSGSRVLHLVDTPVSSAVRMQAIADIIIGSIRRTIAQLDFPVSSSVIVSDLIDTPISDALRSVATINLPVGSGKVTANLTDLPIEASAGIVILVPIDLPIEAVKRSIYTVDIPVESVCRTEAGIVLPVESGVKAIIIADAPVETAMRVVSDADLPVETNFRMLYSVDLPVETIAKMGVTFDLPVETAIGFKATITLAIESGKGLVAIIDCPVESIARTIAAFDLPIEAFVEMSRLLGINVAAIYIRIPGADVLVRVPSADYQIRTAEAEVDIRKPDAKSQIALAHAQVVDLHPKIKR